MKIILIVLLSINLFGCSKNKESLLVEKPKAILEIKHMNSTSTSTLSEGNKVFSKNYDGKVFTASVSITEIDNKETKEYLFKIVDNNKGEIIRRCSFDNTKIEVYKSDLLEVTIKPDLEDENSLL